MTRTIAFDAIVETAAELCRRAAVELPPDVLQALREGAARETSETGREFFRQYLENAEIARATQMPLCQDTGFAVYFVEYGDEIRLDRGTIYEALEEGTKQGYRIHHLRKSIDADPLFRRENTATNTPAVVHLTIVKGDRLHITLAPKGGGSENMSRLKMLKPADGRAGVVDFVVSSVVEAGGNPCPPTVVGVGIGGTAEVAMLLAKKALLRPLGTPNPDSDYAALEKEILEKINRSGCGPQGLGGNVTSLAVHINVHACHLASLPVAVNLNCHAARHAEATL
ncbi:MAG: fumarate hydratase [Victivallaceae bacterium]|nr:fumarate hydratase [Victivallaceae bacterium]